MVRDDAIVRYVIFEKTIDTNRKYIYQISRGSVYTSEDIGNAIEFCDVDTALMVKEHIYKICANRNINKDLHVLQIGVNYAEI